MWNNRKSLIASSHMWKVRVYYTVLYEKYIIPQEYEDTEHLGWEISI